MRAGRYRNLLPMRTARSLRSGFSLARSKLPCEPLLSGAGASMTPIGMHLGVLVMVSPLSLIWGRQGTNVARAPLGPSGPAAPFKLCGLAASPSDGDV